MTFKDRVGKEMRKTTDWREVGYLSDEIEELLGKMARHQLDYTGDLRFCIERLEVLFSESKDKAEKILWEEIEAEDAQHGPDNISR